MACEGIARAVLLVLNLIFFLIGAAALGVGIWVLVDADLFLSLFAQIPVPDSVSGDTTAYGNLIRDAAYIFVISGGVIFTIAFLGCCGAWKKVKILLMLYSIFIILLIALEVACVIVAYFFTDKLNTLITVDLKDYLTSGYSNTLTVSGSDNTVYSYNADTSLTRGIDALQIQLSCCGVNNITDYASAADSLTCCSVATTDVNALGRSIWGGSTSEITFSDAVCPADTADDVTLGHRSSGCYEAIITYVNSKSSIFIGVGAGILGLEVLVIVFACCLYCEYKKQEQD